MTESDKVAKRTPKKTASKTNALATQPAAPPVMDEAQAVIMFLERILADPSVDTAKLCDILKERDKLRKEQECKAFARAMAEFQQRAPIVEPLDEANGRPYARMDRIWRAISPVMMECGLSITWLSCTVADNSCVISGQLWHRDGHHEGIGYTLPMPDELRGQNASQRMGSATTYARRYATAMVLGIQIGHDDDANGAGGAVITEEQAATLREYVNEGHANEGKMLEFGGCTSLDDFPADRYEIAVSTCRKRADRAQGGELPT